MKVSSSVVILAGLTVLTRGIDSFSFPRTTSDPFKSVNWPTSTSNSWSLSNNFPSSSTKITFPPSSSSNPWSTLNNNWPSSTSNTNWPSSLSNTNWPSSTSTTNWPSSTSNTWASTSNVTSSTSNYRSTSDWNSSSYSSSSFLERNWVLMIFLPFFVGIIAWCIYQNCKAKGYISSSSSISTPLLSGQGVEATSNTRMVAIYNPPSDNYSQCGMGSIQSGQPAQIQVITPASYFHGKRHPDTQTFDDTVLLRLDMNASNKISRINVVYNHEFVFGLEIWYKSPGLPGEQSSGRHVGWGAGNIPVQETMIGLDEDEYIVEFFGSSGDLIDSLGFVTSKGDRLQFGGPGGVPFSYRAEPGQHFGTMSIGIGGHLHFVEGRTFPMIRM